MLLWYSLKPNGDSEPDALHGACNVTHATEEKWSANYWIWNKPYDGTLDMMPDYQVPDFFSGC